MTAGDAEMVTSHRGGWCSFFGLAGYPYVKSTYLNAVRFYPEGDGYRAVVHWNAVHEPTRVLVDSADMRRFVESARRQGEFSVVPGLVYSHFRTMAISAQDGKAKVCFPYGDVDIDVSEEQVARMVRALIAGKLLLADFEV